MVSSACYKYPRYRSFQLYLPRLSALARIAPCESRQSRLVCFVAPLAVDQLQHHQSPSPEKNAELRSCGLPE
jgi:hypothetical protein